MLGGSGDQNSSRKKIEEQLTKNAEFQERAQRSFTQYKNSLSGGQILGFNTFHGNPGSRNVFSMLSAEQQSQAVEEASKAVREKQAKFNEICNHLKFIIKALNDYGCEVDANAIDWNERKLAEDGSIQIGEDLYIFYRVDCVPILHYNGVFSIRIALPSPEDCQTPDFEERMERLAYLIDDQINYASKARKNLQIGISNNVDSLIAFGSWLRENPELLTTIDEDAVIDRIIQKIEEKNDCT